MSEAEKAETLAEFHEEEADGSYRCRRCGTSVQGPLQFLQIHTNQHVRNDTKPLPHCKVCEEEMIPGLGEVVSAEPDGPHGTMQVQHSQTFMCVNEDCDMYDVEVPAGHGS
jgi:hypothetical protein